MPTGESDPAGGGARTRNQGGPDTWQQSGGHETDRHEDGPYLDLNRRAWRDLRANTPMSLTAGALDELRGLTDPIQISEVEDVYLPLSRLLRLYFEATAGLRETLGAFLGREIRPARSSSRLPAASPSASPPLRECSRRWSGAGHSTRTPNW